MAELKREYVIPLRRKTRLAPKWRRSKKAVTVLREFIVKHMKSENVVICKELNEAIWENGIKNPPGKVSVVVLKTEVAGEERVLVNLVEAGVDAQMSLYGANMPKVTETKADVKEAVVEEKKVKEVKSEEVKSEKVSEDVKEDKKHE